jgi:hypothetical protein
MSVMPFPQIRENTFVDTSISGYHLFANEQKDIPRQKAAAKWMAMNNEQKKVYNDRAREFNKKNTLSQHEYKIGVKKVMNDNNAGYSAFYKKKVELFQKKYPQKNPQELHEILYGVWTRLANKEPWYQLAGEEMGKNALTYMNLIDRVQLLLYDVYSHGQKQPIKFNVQDGPEKDFVSKRDKRPVGITKETIMKMYDNDFTDEKDPVDKEEIVEQEVELVDDLEVDDIEDDDEEKDRDDYGDEVEYEEIQIEDD